MADALAMVQKFDFATSFADIQATHAHLLEMKECTGRFQIIPEEKIAEVERAVSGRSGVVFHRYDDAGHAFSNWDAPSVYNKEAADLAWSRSLEFLGQHLR